MGSETNLPFKVGDLAELKTFEEGFRGAWFNCKIRRITKRKGELQHLLEYYDFPDEKWEWTCLYQKPPYHVGMGKEKRRELILRPHYPPTYFEKDMPHVRKISEVTVIVNNSWKVGDLVDWWNSDCHWSGRITQLLGDDKAKVELNPQPFGEGLDYDAELKDLRPSLEWSPEHGWTIPTQEGDSGTPCARLIKPIDQAIQETHNKAVEETDPVEGSAGSSDSHLGETVSKQLKDGKENSAMKSGADIDSWPEEGNRAIKKYRASECCFRNSETLEAAMMELEEYVNKVKWLKKILEYGCDAEGPQWEIVDPNSSSQIPK